MAIAKGRWATIVNETGEVSNISNMEGGVQPEVNADARDRYTFEEVDEGVMIGMVRGGPVGSVGGFGWREGESAGGRFGPGIYRSSADKPAIDETALPAVDHDRKVRGDAPAAANDNDPHPAAKPAAAPAKSKRKGKKAA